MATTITKPAPMRAVPNPERRQSRSTWERIEDHVDYLTVKRSRASRSEAPMSWSAFKKKLDR